MPYLTCNDINVYYEIQGYGEPLLFIDGLGSHILRKKEFIDELSNFFQVISFDMRGAGRTDKPDEPYSIEEIAYEAHQLISQLGFVKLHVVGFSMGGCVALELAVNHPDIVNNLVLISTMPAWNRPYHFSEKALKIFKPQKPITEIFEDIYEILHGSEYKKHHSLQDYIDMCKQDPYPQPEAAYLNQLHACENFNLIDALAGIEHPTLIVTGEDDQLVSSENSNWMHEKISNSKLITYPHVGHMVTDEVTAKLVEDITRTLVCLQ